MSHDDDQQPSLSASPRSGVMDESRWESVVANLKTIGGAVVLALIIRTVLFEPFEIDGPSMEPTLLHGDRVVVAKFLYGIFLPLRDEAVVTWGQPNLGDVVILKSPADGVDIVKRVIGLPRDTIELRAGLVYRNGDPLQMRDRGECSVGRGLEHNQDPYRSALHRCHWRESEIDGRTFLTSGGPDSAYHQPVRVPPGEIFVLGDHRDTSNDSRAIGTIPISRIKGRALAIYWSHGDEGLRWSRMLEAVR